MRKCCCPEGLDEKVKATAADTTSNFLNDKLAAGAGISIAVLNPGGDEQVEISAPGSTTDEQVKVTAADTTPGFLAPKVVAGAGISLAVLNPGADEDLEITNTNPTNTDELVSITGADTTPGFLGSKVVAGAGIMLNVLNPGGDEDLEIVNTGVTATPSAEWLPTPEVLTEETGNDPARDVFVGGSYLLPIPVTFNRIGIRVLNVGLGLTALGRLAIYQKAGGNVTSSIALVRTVDFSHTEPPADSNLILTVPATSLVPGIFWAIWGRRSGAVAFNLATYEVLATGNGNLRLQNMIAGTHPPGFETSIASTAASPATINPLAGGGDVTGNTDDNVPTLRLFTV